LLTDKFNGGVIEQMNDSGDNIKLPLFMFNFREITKNVLILGNCQF